MKPVRLPAAATRALPRWLLLLLCALYIVPGLVGRDPWKTVDAASFGVMWTMAQGNFSDWLAPNIVGFATPDRGPLAFWVGAIFIKLFGGIVGDILATRLSALMFFLIGAASVWYSTYLLGRRPEAQPMRLAFGGQPDPRSYGRTLADGALLIYLGCLGLLLINHSPSAEALQVALVAYSLYGAARLYDRPKARSAALFGLTLGLLALTRGWIVPCALGLATLALASFHNKAMVSRLLTITLPISIALSLPWFILASQDAHGQIALAEWLNWNLAQLALPSFESLRYLAKNGIWFVWPAWPFAAWAVYAWRQEKAGPHILLPLFFAAAALTIALFNPSPDEGTLIPLVPAMAMLAAFGLPTMKRGTINAVDWFSVMTLTTCAGLIWLGWVAMQTGWPAQLARNVYKAAPGFEAEFHVIGFAAAAIATVSWFVVVYWRISRRPPVLWRAVVLSSGGVILCWLLLMTLWLPWVNYGKSYAGVARELTSSLPSEAYCVQTNLGRAQRATFAYFGEVAFSRSNDQQCRLLLWQDYHRGADDSTRVDYDNAQWDLLWEGRRPADRDERFRLYRRAD